jgi:predicted  nucleic acid-binding Zn-ribbon protein
MLNETEKFCLYRNAFEKVEKLEGDLAMRDAEIDELENTAGKAVKDLQSEIADLNDEVWKREQERDSLQEQLDSK